MNRSVKKKEKKTLVIPLIARNQWRGADNAKQDKEVCQLEALAAQEIIQETENAANGWENRADCFSNIEIPSFMLNKVPCGFETDDKMDVSLRANEVFIIIYYQ